MSTSPSSRPVSKHRFLISRKSKAKNDITVCTSLAQDGVVSHSAGMAETIQLQSLQA